MRIKVRQNLKTMKLLFSIGLYFFCFLCKTATSQAIPIDKVKFFEDTSVLNVTLKTNMQKIFKSINKTGAKFPAVFSVTFPDGTEVNEPISLEIRGHFRKQYCYIPPLKVLFKSKKASALNSLGTLKLVSQCKTSETYQQYLVSEWLIYKMFNLLTDKSFRVRLLNINIIDTTGKKKTIKENAFLVERMKDLAKRNDCSVVKKKNISYNATDRQQMTLVDIFEYMIGNTDWGVSTSHNIRLLHSKSDSLSLAYVIPYDFDYSGLINADYAKPNPKLNISNVQERLYRGFPRTINEINEALNLFKKQESNFYSLINNCSLLNSRTKKNLTDYLDSFFDLIKNPDDVYNTFVRNARKN